MTIREQITACNTSFALTVLYKNLNALEESFQDGNTNYVDYKIQELDILNDIADLIFYDKEENPMEDAWQ
jgi:hypothetical protein